MAFYYNMTLKITLNIMTGTLPGSMLGGTRSQTIEDTSSHWSTTVTGDGKGGNDGIW